MTLKLEPGQKIGKMEVVRLEQAHRPRLWRFRCECGKEVVLSPGRLTNKARTRRTCGSAECQKRGRRGTRPRGENYFKAVSLREQGVGGDEIARTLGISRQRVYQLLDSHDKADSSLTVGQATANVGP